MHRGSILVLALLTCAAVPAQDQKRPNILFLLADDHRPDAVRAFGNPHIQTPHLDSLATRGFRFERTYCMGSTHGAVCQPSRAMIHSGRTLYRVKMNLKGSPTLGELLRGAGYATFGTGKWHNGGASFLRSFERGRNVMLGGMSNHLKVPVQHIQSDGELSPRTVGEKFSSVLFADSAVEFLGSLDDSSEPFFALVDVFRGHSRRSF